MKALNELAEMVHNTKVKEVDFVLKTKNDDTPLSALFAGILNKEFKNDQEAANKILDVDATDQLYQRLRRKLKRSLLNAVFFFDLPQSEYNDRQRAYHESYKTWAAAKILLGRNANHIGIELCHKLLKKSEKYDFSDLVVDITRNLRLHYATKEGNLKKYEYYNKLYKKYETIWLEENTAEEMYMELVLRYVNSQSVFEETPTKAIEFYEKIQDSLTRNNSYRLHLCGMLIRQAIYSTKNDWPGMIEVCDEALAFFKAKPYNASVPLQIAYYQKIIAYTQLRKFEEGQEAAISCLSHLEPGSFNWFKYQELYLILSMHTAQYQQAFEVLHETIKHRRFQFLSLAAAEIWKIYEAYLYYLSEVGEITTNPDDDSFSKFKVGRFMNDTPIFSRDKRGMNIPILIIQILFKLRNKNYDQTILDIENIERYCARYLRQGETFRSNCFIKMLLVIPNCRFHREAVVRKTTKLFKRLQSLPSSDTTSTVIEIIPYENLWSFVLDSLENQLVYLRRKKTNSP